MWFYRTADDERGTVGTRIEVNKRPIEKFDINAIPIPRIEKVLISFHLITDSYYSINLIR